MMVKDGALEGYLDELRGLNAAIAEKETELAARASALLEVWRKHRDELGEMRKRRGIVFRSLYGVIDEVTGLKMAPADLDEVERALGVMRGR